MCQTLLYTRRRKTNKNTTQYVLDTANTRRRETNKNTTQYVLDTAKHKTKKNKQKHNTICDRHCYTQDEEKQTKTQHNM